MEPVELEPGPAVVEVLVSVLVSVAVVVVVVVVVAAVAVPVAAAVPVSVAAVPAAVASVPVELVASPGPDPAAEAPAVVVEVSAVAVVPVVSHPRPLHRRPRLRRLINRNQVIPEALQAELEARLLRLLARREDRADIVGIRRETSTRSHRAIIRRSVSRANQR